jgi:hypothetical protein
MVYYAEFTNANNVDGMVEDECSQYCAQHGCFFYRALDSYNGESTGDRDGSSYPPWFNCNNHERPNSFQPTNIISIVNEIAVENNEFYETAKSTFVENYNNYKTDFLITLDRLRAAERKLLMEVHYRRWKLLYQDCIEQ